MDSIEKGMTNNAIVFDIHDNIGPCILDTSPIGYRKMTFHMIFYVKLDAGFTRKARIVADGHKVNTPPSMKYASFVLWESVIILFLITDLNGLGGQWSGVQNA